MLEERKHIPTQLLLPYFKLEPISHQPHLVSYQISPWSVSGKPSNTLYQS
jgi:hypothetical protein